MHNAIAHQEVESPWLCGTTALQQLTHPCAITTILILDPKDTTIPATIKEINYPAKTRAILATKKERGVNTFVFNQRSLKNKQNFQYIQKLLPYYSWENPRLQAVLMQRLLIIRVKILNLQN